MDKLKKFKPYYFWVIAGVAVVIPFVAWQTARSGMVNDFTSRKQAIDAKFKLIPAGSDHKNEKWKQSLETVNVSQAEKLNSAWLERWEKQEKLMVWPGELADKISDPLKATGRDLDVYRELYKYEVAKVWHSVEPIQSRKPNSKVHFPWELMPHDENLIAGDLPPSPRQMKDAQEDLWLLTNLFAIIREMNSKAEKGQYDADIRKIEKVELRGGSPRPPPAPPGQPGQPAQPPQPQFNPYTPVDPRTGLPMMAGAGGATLGLAAAKVEFNVDDEFGPEVPFKPPADPNAPQQPGAVPGQPAPPPPQPPLGAELGMRGNAKGPMDRYIEQNAKWKTRGFYLKLVMDHRRLPQFLATLGNTGAQEGNWPIRVLRVHQVDLHPEDLQDINAPGGSSPTPGIPPTRRPNTTTPFGPGGVEPIGGVFGPQPTVGGPGSPTTGFDVETAAMLDPMLAVIAISGTFTIYNPPPPEVLAAINSAKQKAAAAPGTPGSEAAPPGTTAPGTSAPGTTAPGTPTPNGQPAPPAAGTTPPTPGTAPPAPGTTPAAAGGNPPTPAGAAAPVAAPATTTPPAGAPATVPPKPGG